MDTDIKATPPDEPTPPLTPRVVTRVVENQNSIFFTLLMYIAGSMVLALMSAYHWLPEAKMTILAWTCLTNLGFVVSAIFLRLEARNMPRHTWALSWLLATGAWMGLMLALGGVLLTMSFWTDVLAMLGRGTPEKGAWWHALLAVTTTFVGLAAMFGSLQLGRSEERTNPTVRRLLYGYNAALTAILLLMLMAVVNVVVAAKFDTPLDFTKSRQYTLAPQSLSILRNLESPVEITLIPGFDDGLVEDETRTLLANVKGASDKISVTELSPLVDQQRTRELAAKYPNLTRGCLLLTFKVGDKEDHRVITEKELVQAPDPMMMGRGAPPEHKFVGEDALMTVLASLGDSKGVPVAYFLQGHLELDLADANPGEQALGAGILKRRLEAKRRIEIKPLQFELGANPVVPKDCELLFIAGPRRTIPIGEANAIKEYVNRGGKLIVMADPVVVGGKMVPTGLEDVLQDLGVTLPAERILTLPSANAPFDVVDVLGAMNPKLLNQNPLVKEFRERVFPFEDCRPVATGANEAAPGRFQAQNLVLSVTPSFTETKLDVDPSQMVESILKNAKELDAKRKQLRNIPLVAVVSDSGMTMPGHPPMGDSKPRAAVFGNASFAANRNMDERANSPSFHLLNSCVEWLVRDKKANLGIAPVVRQGFNLTPKSAGEENRMIFLPPVLVITCVLGLAMGVWIVRRR